MQQMTLSTDGSSEASGPERAHETAPHQPFAIAAAASLEALRPLILKYGDSFAVFDRSGDAAPGSGIALGLYHLDTRHLCRLALTFAGARPILLSSTLRDDNATLTCDLSNPDLFDASGRLRV